MLPLIRTVFYSAFIIGCSGLFLSYLLHQDNFFTRHVQNQQAYARSRLGVTQLNYLIPSFKELVTNVGRPEAVSINQWQAYAAYYGKVIELLPAYDDAYVFLGMCFFYLGQKEKAYEHFQKALLLRPDSFWANYNFGIMSAQGGDCIRAVGSFGKMVQLKPADVAGRMAASKLYSEIALGQENFGSLAEQGITAAYGNVVELGGIAQACAQGQMQAVRLLLEKARAVQIRVF